MMNGAWKCVEVVSQRLAEIGQDWACQVDEVTLAVEKDNRRLLVLRFNFLVRSNSSQAIGVENSTENARGVDRMIENARKTNTSWVVARAEKFARTWNTGRSCAKRVSWCGFRRSCKVDALDLFAPLF